MSDENAKALSKGAQQSGLGDWVKKWKELFNHDNPSPSSVTYPDQYGPTDEEMNAKQNALQSMSSDGVGTPITHSPEELAALKKQENDYNQEKANAYKQQQGQDAGAALNQGQVSNVGNPDQTQQFQDLQRIEAQKRQMQQADMQNRFQELRKRGYIP